MALRDIIHLLGIRCCKCPTPHSDHCHISQKRVIAYGCGRRVCVQGIASDSKPSGRCPFVYGAFLEGKVANGLFFAIHIETGYEVKPVINDNVVGIVGGQGAGSNPRPLCLGIAAVGLVALRGGGVADVALRIHVQTESVAVDEAKRPRAGLGFGGIVLAIYLYAIGIGELTHDAWLVAHEVLEELQLVTVELRLIGANVGIILQGYVARHLYWYVVV